MTTNNLFTVATADDLTPIVTGEMSNVCFCLAYDSETGETTDEPSTECFGCFDDAVEMFGDDVKHLFELFGHDRWQIVGFPVWNGTVDGRFEASNPTELVRAMTVRSEWSMTYRVYDDRVEYSLSHHDAPTGSLTILTPIDDDSVWY